MTQLPSEKLELFNGRHFNHLLIIQANGSQAPHQAVAELKAEGVLPAQTLVRNNEYLNNMIEQDHRMVKQRCYPTLGGKTFGNAQVTLREIELANKIKKGPGHTTNA